MDIDVLLLYLKIDLGINRDTYDARLTSDLETAQAEIQREGIVLTDDSSDDIDLVVMYAAWLWNKRRTGEKMPRMLRYLLNNHLFAQKAVTE